VPRWISAFRAFYPIIAAIAEDLQKAGYKSVQIVESYGDAGAFEEIGLKQDVRKLPEYLNAMGVAAEPETANANDAFADDFPWDALNKEFGNMQPGEVRARFPETSPLKLLNFNKESENW
jgi:hypothetical protein